MANGGKKVSSASNRKRLLASSPGSPLPLCFQQPSPAAAESEESHFPESLTELYLESIKLEVCGSIFSPVSGWDEKGRCSRVAAAVLRGWGGWGDFPAVSLCGFILGAGLPECPLEGQVQSVSVYVVSVCNGFIFSSGEPQLSFFSKCRETWLQCETGTKLNLKLNSNTGDPTVRGPL